MSLEHNTLPLTAESPADPTSPTVPTTPTGPICPIGPSGQFVRPRISEIAGGLIFCIQGQGRHPINISRTSSELRHLLSLLETGRLREVAGFATLPDDLLQLKAVVLCGTCDHAPNFDALLQELNRIREMSRFPEYKMVWITDGQALETPKKGIDLLRASDEIWIHLDCGALPYQSRTETSSPPSLSNATSSATKTRTQRLDLPGFRDNHQITRNILGIALHRPVVIQSAFYCLHGEAPTESEVKNFIRHLKKLRRCGAQIALIQVCSPAHREPRRGQLKLKTLSLIARQIREGTGLQTEFY